MWQESSFEVVCNQPGGYLVIRDIGGDGYLTVTNDAEGVVKKLVKLELLTDDKRLLYYDSDGQLDEILVEDGEFSGFAPAPKDYQP